MSDIHASAETHRAGAFDVRTFIALLIGIYGIVLVAMGLFGTTEGDLAKADDFNVNLWAGIGMVVVAAFLQGWAMLRPVVVPDDPADRDTGPDGDAVAMGGEDRP